jgi:hypothetical protein
VKRYSIFAVPTGGQREIEVAQVDRNPEHIMRGVRNKVIFAGRHNKRPVWSEMYESVRIQENDTGR